MQSAPSLPSLPGSLWLGVKAPERVLSVDQIELNSIPMLTELFELEQFCHLTVYKQKLYSSYTELFEIELFD